MNKPSEKSKLAMKLLIVVFGAAMLLGFALWANKKPQEKPTIVASNFVSYDLARAVMGSDEGIKLLVAPGSDLHHYEPSQQDVINIKQSKLFIYTGGESEMWVESLFNDRQESNTLRLIDTDGLKLLKEDGEDEIDEHFWTSPSNYILMLDAVEAKMAEIDPGNADKYKENANDYREQIRELDGDIREMIATTNKKTVVFADRFPAKYFFEEYGLDYIAAFPGCAEDTEADAATISNLINLIKLKKINAVFTIELSDKRLANTIAGSTRVKILGFQSLQNISKDDFANNKTYVDLMTENIEPLREALD
jgi:zinc transport system substrate-binding protein